MNGTSHFMACLKRSSEAGNPLSPIGFYSFVEDWNRNKGARGCHKKRRAKFLQPKFNNKLLENATFFKIETGYDEFAADFAKGWGSENGFVLETGSDGRTARAIEETVSDNTLLTLKVPMHIPFGHMALT